MARASTRTKLPLATWAKIMGMHPLHFSGVQYGTQSHCQSALPQYTWQEADRISREEIAEAIQEAEGILERMLGYRLLPAWEVDEWRPGIRPYRAELFNVGSRDLRGFEQVVDAKWGHFISGGVETKSLIAATQAIVWSDDDGDGYKETGTVTSAVASGQDPCEVEIYFPGKSGADAWQIRPASVTIAGLVATITFRRELAVDPDLQESLTFQVAEGDDDADFLTTVDVYRRYNDPQTQASFLWEPLPDCGACGGSSCSLCVFTTQTGCLLPRGDPRLGMLAFSPGDWDADEEEFTSVGWSINRTPDVVRLYYRSGYRDQRKICPNREMDDSLARMVAYLAAAVLDRQPCDCSSSQWGHWHKDLGEDLEFAAQTSILNNPIGTRRGEVYAWQRLRNAHELAPIGRGGLA